MTSKYPGRRPWQQSYRVGDEIRWENLRQVFMRVLTGKFWIR